MEESPVTRASLLIRISQREDQVAWSEFVEIYVPLIYTYARKKGLQDADASDVAQDVITSVNNAIDRFEYDPRQGKFRGYLQILEEELWKSWLWKFRRACDAGPDRS